MRTSLPAYIAVFFFACFVVDDGFLRGRGGCEFDPLEGERGHIDNVKFASTCDHGRRCRCHLFSSACYTHKSRHQHPPASLSMSDTATPPAPTFAINTLHITTQQATALSG
ncbi:hypothetical protein CLAFUW4_20099 [Fulvia fulva]|uniref:uncharacterized protein n=1 Tax=Passalora fulva TaxID=5499 RepID=UPI0028529AA0|nr:uncharacterized protein CLAFUR5_20099 [Fulvia fulva]KAK4612008.1 hypothetical protein CLAFUR4_20099 [Fulvia fulva]KAK4612367.1 hypothetical protein CLAFUR0_20099 [Fulvia fulva]WMI39056.1 hypothetical protein CLAFUR5_20099 [Fulvia fulva]WPV21292.1 hypothetical protein CLAFUW4_20099 [Fulvia fulva]WPV35981.1 hypothetical protein CLAFUW7_20099 [Fulvia fulva]